MSVHDFTVYDIIARGADVYGDAPALFQGEQQWSFAEFRHRVDRLAAGLHALGLRAGERVAILAQNDVAYLDLYGACARQGIVAYPINWRLTAAEVERVVERADPRMMVADASTAGLLAGWLDARPAVAHRVQLGAPPLAPGFSAFADLYRDGAAPAPAVSASDVFAVISTAAVDVVPRGAALTHANVVTANLTAIGAIGYLRDERYLLALPLFHVTALGGAMSHMHAGGSSVIVSRFEADEAVRLIDQRRITHVSDFPPVLVSLLDAAKKAGSRLPSLRHVSGLDSPATIERLHQKTAAQFWTGFGQSETSGFVTIQRVADKPGASGRAGAGGAGEPRGRLRPRRRRPARRGRSWCGARSSSRATSASPT